MSEGSNRSPARPALDERRHGDGKNRVDRLGRELSGYYLLGFEPSDAIAPAASDASRCR